MSAPTITFEIVRPLTEHARLVLEWRNDPDTLAASFHPTAHSLGEFLPRFQRDYFTDPALPPLFALADGRRVAFLRFRTAPHPLFPSRPCCELSINVAPAERGRGLGTAVLVAASEELRGRGVEAVLAEIRAGNAASLRAFEKAGYEALGPAEKLVEDTGERCSIHRYLARLRGAAWERGVFVIAEAGSNWRMGTPARDRAMALELIEVAAESGADAVKFQTFRPETIYVAEAGSSGYLSAAGIELDMRTLFADLAMPYELLPELASACAARGLAFMSTPFSPDDFAAVDPHVQVHKCASYEISHVRLLQLFARARKPLVLSTGAADPEDIAWAVETYRAHGGRDLCLLQCTASYPAPVDQLNLSVIPWLARRFGAHAGLSDHSRDPVAAPVAAVGLGARVIEKHFTLDNRLPGPDHAFAVSPPELRRMVAAVRDAERALGSGLKQVLPAEQELRLFARRGLQASRPISTGEPLREGVNVEILRPGRQRQGLHPRRLEEMEGRRSRRDIPAGDGIQESDLGER